MMFIPAMSVRLPPIDVRGHSPLRDLSNVSSTSYTHTFIVTPFPNSETFLLLAILSVNGFYLFIYGLYVSKAQADQRTSYM